MKKKPEEKSLNRPLTSDEIEAIIKKLLDTLALDWMLSQGNFKEELTLIVLRLFQKIQEEGRLPNSFHETSTILFSKPDKDTTKKEKFRPISLLNIDAIILNTILTNCIQQYVIKVIHHDQVASSQGWKYSTVFTNQ